MRTVRPAKVAGYVVVGSGVDPSIDSPTLFHDIQAWVVWKKALSSYELEAIPADRLEADEMLVPAAVVNGPVRFAFMVRLAVWWRNIIRRRINAEHRAREARYFSEQVVNARRKASQ